MMWYGDHLLWFDSAPPVRCTMCCGQATLCDAIDGTPLCASDCLEAYWRQRMHQAAARWRLVHGAREAWEVAIVAESRLEAAS
jgi:hypothetical protein